MKSKITLIILLVAIVILATTTVVFGYKYNKEKQSAQSLTSEVEELKANSELEESESSQVIEKEVLKYTISKFDSDKVDASQREEVYESCEECGEYLENSSGIRYRVGTSKNISTFSSNSEVNSQIIYNGKEYNVSDNNIVSLKTQYHGNATDWYYSIT